MKKLFVLALAAMALSSSAFADRGYHRDYNRGGHHHGQGGLGELVVGAVVLTGAAVVINQLFPSRVVVVEQPRVICRIVPVTDQLGRGLYDRYTGQQLTTQVCQEVR